MLFLPLLALTAPAAAPQDTPHSLSEFERHELTDVYYSEGATAGDLNADGICDLVYGPHWYAGPDFARAREIYPAEPQPTEFYANSFFDWLYDFDGDGDLDLLMVGLPGTPAFLFEHPEAEALDQHWKRHVVLDSVSNESPQFVNLVGDERPELVCTRQGVFGFASVNWESPLSAWSFHAISDLETAARFGHGLGVGDLNADGRADVLHAGGWFEQPESQPETQPWTNHEVAFTNAYGGADMFAYDVDGDGDQDVITSLAAHDFGLAWYEQRVEGTQRSFHEHLIMGASPEQNAYGLVFSELHSLNLVDMDGDGLRDIVTGKTYYSHHQKSPLWNAGALVVCFRLVRDEGGVDWRPYVLNDETGIGRQLGIFDVDADGLPDILVGGMKGGNVLLQRRREVDRATWLAAQPRPFAGASERADRGPEEVLDEATGRVPGAIEAESMKVLYKSTGTVGTQDMGGFEGDRWSGGEQLFWSGATPRASLVLEFEVAEGGDFELEASFTVAPDYAILQLTLDEVALGPALDLFHYPGVRSTGSLALGRRELSAGPHRLSLETIGANAAAVPAHMVGFDYLLLHAR